MSFKSGFES